MTTVEQSIEVDAPLRQTYDQWTQFEEFPQFMEHIDSVVQTDDTHLTWRATIAGKEETWDSVITEQHPDERIAWKSTSGAEHAGRVSFQRIEDGRTRVNLQLDGEPHTMVEKIGDALGVLEREAKGDLERFKAFIEERGAATGGWREDVRGGRVEDSSGDIEPPATGI